MNKKIIIVSICSACFIALGFAYFILWNEPASTYSKTNNPQLIAIREQLDNLKEELKSKGRYNCCIKNDCNWCALYMGHCPCGQLVSEKGNEKSCPECAAAWNRKQGKVPGVDADAIDVTTFGVYGFEKDGHHSIEKDKDEQKHHD